MKNGAAEIEVFLVSKKMSCEIVYNNCCLTLTEAWIICGVKLDGCLLYPVDCESTLLRLSVAGRQTSHGLLALYIDSGVRLIYFSLKSETNPHLSSI